jgi:hypothetical protein
MCRHARVIVIPGGISSGEAIANYWGSGEGPTAALPDWYS